jgi:ribosomal protein L18
MTQNVFQGALVKIAYRLVDIQVSAAAVLGVNIGTHCIEQGVQLYGGIFTKARFRFHGRVSEI